MYENATDLVRIQFYYATLSYTVVEEKLRYSGDDLISSVGGQMGLWLGISLISFYDGAMILLRWWGNRKHAGYKKNKILEKEIEMTLFSRTNKKY